jgi:hypothetical protein
VTIRDRDPRGEPRCRDHDRDERQSRLPVPLKEDP